MTPISALTARRARHLLLGAAILSASVVAPSLVAPDTQAQTSACASEPVAILSNGVAMDMDATIQDSASDVSNVNYVLKVPKGVTVKSWTDTTELGPNDTYSVQSNNTDSYTVNVSVRTGTKVNATASGELVSVTTGLQVASSSASGDTNSAALVLSL